MILDGEFFSGGHLRWNLGWPTPNYAGAFLVTLLALVFVFSGSRWRGAVLVAEAGGLFLLAKTYSRGAVVAWGLAWLFGVVASRGWRDPSERLVWAARAVVLAVMMIVVGFEWNRAAGDQSESMHGTSASDGPTGGRVATIEKDHAVPTVDGSVVNRLALWRGGLKMIAAAPLSGWGAGESGRAYMNWFQDLGRSEGYATMVNSYLHVAVERGLPVLALVLFALVWLVGLAWRGARSDVGSGQGVLGATRPTMMMAAGASLVAWAVANVFTTLWIEPKLWMVPVVAVLALMWGAGESSGIRLVSLTVASLVIAVFAAAGLYGTGRWLLRSQPLSCIPGTNGSVVLASAGADGPVWHVWPDPTVLGSTPGKELRRWVEAESINIRLVVHRAAPLQPGEIPAGANGLLLFGRQAGRIGPNFPTDCRELWVMHPTLPSPSSVKWPNLSPPMITIVLPQIDEAGNGPAWRQLAKQIGARVLESPASGLDIRAVWPEIFLLHSNQPPASGVKSTKESAFHLRVFL